jgi:Dyp-type peroxidase family
VSSVVAVDEVQGNVLHAYRDADGHVFGYATYLRYLVREGMAEAAVGLIGRLAEKEVTFGQPTAESNESHVNLAFSYAGLEALEVPESVRGEFPLEFRQGARSRAGDLGDTWPDKEKFKDAHILLSVVACSSAARDERVERLQRALAVNGGPLALVECQHAELLAARGAREHFGFADGRSQPAIAGVDLDPAGDGIYATATPTGRAARALTGLGVRNPPRRWRLLRTGEFLLGYDNEDGALPKGPRAPLGPNGTFMVYRKMAQHVGVFQRFITESAAALRMDEDVLRAKILGRWPDGTPLASSQVEDPAIATDRRRANDFLYAKDPNGLACPLGAHVRRANPRDGLPGGAERTMRHRIIRRGMPYTDSNGEQGLIFICLGASLANGFEFIQRRWIADGEALGLGPDPDFLLAPAESGARMRIGGPRNATLRAPKKAFVTVRGCEYLFVPSRRGCEWIGRPERL